MAYSAQAVLSGVPLIYLVLAVGLLAVAYLGRQRQLQL